MSATQTVQLIEKLVKDKISKKTATDLLDYIESNKTDATLKTDIHWIKWILSLGLPLFFSIMLSVMLYLHNTTGKRIGSVEKNVESIEKRIESIERDIKEIKSILLKK